MEMHNQDQPISHTSALWALKAEVATFHQAWKVTRHLLIWLTMMRRESGALCAVKNGKELPLLENRLIIPGSRRRDCSGNLLTNLKIRKSGQLTMISTCTIIGLPTPKDFQRPLRLRWPFTLVLEVSWRSMLSHASSIRPVIYNQM